MHSDTDWIQPDSIGRNTVFILPLASNSKDRVLALGRVEPCIHSTYTLSGGQLEEVTGSSCLCLLPMKQTGLCAKHLQGAESGSHNVFNLSSPDLSKYANPHISILGLCCIIYVCHFSVHRMCSWFASHWSARPPLRMSVPRWEQLSQNVKTRWDKNGEFLEIVRKEMHKTKCCMWCRAAWLWRK